MIKVIGIIFLELPPKFDLGAGKVCMKEFYSMAKFTSNLVKMLS